MIARLWFWIWDKPFACGCGTTFRNEEAMQRHDHRHYEAAMRLAKRLR